MGCRQNKSLNHDVSFASFHYCLGEEGAVVTAGQ